MVCVAWPRDAQSPKRRAAIVKTDKSTSIAIHTANENRRQFSRVFGTPNTSSQSHMMRQSLNCSYERSSQRNLRIMWLDRKSTRLNSSHQIISYAVFCLKKKKKINMQLKFI